jgi:hypothetical protein
VLIVTHKRGKRRKKEQEEKVQFGEPRRVGGRERSWHCWDMGVE